LFSFFLCFSELLSSADPSNIQASDFFNRSWEEYKVGFNDSSGNLWIGNDLLHELTKNNRYRLRIDVQQASTDQWFWAEYSRFIVRSEEEGYRINIGGYTGNAGDDAMRYINGWKSSTYDLDNDFLSTNCAADFGGGFWYFGCSRCVITAKIAQVWWGLPGNRTLGELRYLKFSRMWLSCY